MKAVQQAGIGIAVVAATIVGMPWLLYGFALSQVEGRPEPATAPPGELLSAWHACREPGPIYVRRMTPLDTAVSLLSDDPTASSPGERAAWAVARHYNMTHLSGHSWWHPAGAALTIWITRNWSADQLASTVAARGYCRAAPNNSSKPTPLRGAA